MLKQEQKVEKKYFQIHEENEKRKMISLTMKGIEKVGLQQLAEWRK